MIKRLLLVIAVGATVSGCFMAPLALIGPVSSGWSTASIIQSGATTGVSYLVKKSTGKSISEHAIDALNKEVIQHTYLPEKSATLLIAP